MNNIKWKRVLKSNIQSEGIKISGLIENIDSFVEIITMKLFYFFLLVFKLLYGRGALDV